MNADYRNEGFRRQASGDTTPASTPSPPPGTPPTQAPRKRSNVLKVVLIVVAVIVVANLALGLLVLGTLSLGLSKCTAALSDDAIGDSPKTLSFIEDRTATARDLEVFDALRGSLDSLYDRRLAQADYDRASGETDVEDPLPIDDLRAQVAQGSWPAASSYGGSESSINPQLWCRLAELAQDWMQEQSGETWQVVDFAYPFPSNDPIPIPPKRDEDDAARTLLVCTDGADKGLYATVRHFRWQTPARWESDLAEARTRCDESRALSDELAAHPQLEGRQVLAQGGALAVWETGQDDPLRSPETFTALVNELCTTHSELYNVSLLAHDTPVMLSYLPISYDYPNEKPLERTSFDDARALLPQADGRYELDVAQGDVLLNARHSGDEDVEAEDLRGTVAPSPQKEYHHPWGAPDAQARPDEGLARIVQEVSESDDTSSIIALSLNEPPSYGDLSTTSWVIVPRGLLGETPASFCSAVNDIFMQSWERMERSDEGKTSLYLHLYVIDEASVCDAEGAAASFAELCAVAQQDPSRLDDYSFVCTLSAMPSAVIWEDEDEPHLSLCTKDDVGGTLSYTRAWVYDDQSL